MLPEERLEVTRHALEAVNEDDWNAVAARLAPDVLFDNTRSRGPQRGVYRGRDELRRLWEQMTQIWESVQVELGDVRLIGETVLAPRAFRARGREGIEVIARSTWLVTFDDDKIARICMYQEEQEAIEAAQASLVSD